MKTRFGASICLASPAILLIYAALQPLAYKKTSAPPDDQHRVRIQTKKT